MLNTPRFDIEDTTMMRAVQFIIENDRILQRRFSSIFLKGLLMRTTSKKSMQLTFVPDNHDRPILALMILHNHYLSLPFSQLPTFTHIN